MISKEEIQKLATLARLELSESEVGSLQSDISNILEYVGQINAAEAGSGEKASSTAPAHHNIMRADMPRAEGDQMAGKQEPIMEQFPQREKDYLVVRKILQKDE